MPNESLNIIAWVSILGLSLPEANRKKKIRIVPVFIRKKKAEQV